MKAPQYSTACLRPCFGPSRLPYIHMVLYRSCMQSYSHRRPNYRQTRGAVGAVPLPIPPYTLSPMPKDTVKACHVQGHPALGRLKANGLLVALHARVITADPNASGLLARPRGYPVP